jgi:hypothetical protein
VAVALEVTAEFALAAAAAAAAFAFAAGARIRRRALIIQLETWLMLKPVSEHNHFFSSSVG